MSTSSSEYSERVASMAGKAVAVRSWACRSKSNTPVYDDACISNRAVRPKGEKFIGAVGKGYGVRGG